MAKYIFILLILSFLALSYGSKCSNIYKRKIVVDKNIDVGSVVISNSDKFLHIKIKGSDDWLVHLLHVYIGGLAKPLYSEEFEATDSYHGIFPIPNKNNCDSLLGISIFTGMIKIDHVHSEPGWVNGKLLDNPIGKRIFDFQLECECGNGGDQKDITPHIEQCCGGSDSSGSNPGFDNGCSQILTTPFYAGQTIHSGDLMIENGENDITLTIQSIDGWKMTEIHIFIGTGVPETFSPGQFSWQIAYSEGVTYYQLHINIVGNNLVLDDGTQPKTWNEKFDGIECDKELKIAVHTTNIKEGDDSETGWAFGDWSIDPKEKRWGWGVTYPFCCKEEDKHKCTYTQGYWKNHNKYAKQTKNQINWPINEDLRVCGQTFYDILLTPPKGDTWLILAHQWISTILNIENGAADSAIEESATKAGVLLQIYCGSGGSDGIPKSLKNGVIDISTILDDYNNGIIGPGHCDENMIEDQFCEYRCVNNDTELPVFELEKGEYTTTKLIMKDGLMFKLVNIKGTAKFSNNGNHKRSVDENGYISVSTEGISDETAVGYIKISELQKLKTGTVNTKNKTTKINFISLIANVSIYVLISILSTIMIVIVIIVKKRRNKNHDKFFILEEIGDTEFTPTAQDDYRVDQN